MEDPGFPRGGGAHLQGGGANLLFGQKFPENCMKMKELRPKGGGPRPWRPLRSANENGHGEAFTNVCVFLGFFLSENFFPNSLRLHSSFVLYC